MSLENLYKYGRCSDYVGADAIRLDITEVFNTRLVSRITFAV